jgi:hypothetical protein
MVHVYAASLCYVTVPDRRRTPVGEQGMVRMAAIGDATLELESRTAAAVR